MMIPERAPVCLLSAQLEELEYGKLYEAYSSKGRKSAADPRVLFKVLVHGYLCGIYSSRKLEEACQYRIVEYDPEADSFTCAQGRKLYRRREATEVQDGQLVSTAWYRCEDCGGCPCRAQCCRAKALDKPKEIILKKTFWEKREQAEKNIRTERGIHLRLCRSIQVEGAFGLLKNDFGFRRFLTWGKANIRTELFLLAWPLT